MKKTKVNILDTLSSVPKKGLYKLKPGANTDDFEVLLKSKTQDKIYLVDQEDLLVSGSGADLPTLINAQSSLPIDDDAGLAEVGTTGGKITLQTILDIVIEASQSYTDVRLVTSDGDWLETDKDKLVVINGDVTLSMPATSPFANKDIVYVMTQKLATDTNSGKFQMRNGGTYAVNQFIDYSPQQDQYEISKMKWVESENRFQPIGTAYILDADGLLKSSAKYFYDNRASGNQGLATLVAGTVTVANLQVKSNSVINLRLETPGGAVGYHYVSQVDITDGVGFVINSTSALDTSTIKWVILN